MASLALPTTRVFKYVNLMSSLRACESIALLNWPYHSCHCKGLPLNLARFKSGRRSFLLRIRSWVFYCNRTRCLKRCGVNHWRRKRVIRECRHRVARGGRWRKYLRRYTRARDRILVVCCTANCGGRNRYTCVHIYR